MRREGNRTSLLCDSDLSWRARRGGERLSVRGGDGMTGRRWHYARKPWVKECWDVDTLLGKYIQGRVRKR